MQVPFLLRAPYEIFIRENITFIVWFLLVLFGSLSGLIALSGSCTPLKTYLLSGSYYITVISLSAVYISDTTIYLLDKHRQDEKTDSALPIQILLIIICIFLIFLSSIEFKNVLLLTKIEEQDSYIKNNWQFWIYFITLIVGIYAYSINRLSKYPDLLKYLILTDKAKKLELTEDGENI